ncbi:hypothetical protein AB0I69_45815 [Streptomyces sp. NPDC050508]|uniref:hypothetical protein n=1 Tax=Streptomyces sp. NPDC050508 TaxID=3155405 RepID=UPI003416E1CB
MSSTRPDGRRCVANLSGTAVELPPGEVLISSVPRRTAGGSGRTRRPGWRRQADRPASSPCRGIR